MGLGEKIIASIISVSMVGLSPKFSTNTKMDIQRNSDNVENVIQKTKNLQGDSVMIKNQKIIGDQIYVCLATDSENSFTHTNALEKVLDPQNTVLEYPIAQLFQKYGNRNHPLAVSGVKKDFRALLGKNGIERLILKHHQKITPRSEKITSDTKYEVKDTIRFSLIDPLLKDDFPQYLSTQLKEEGFEGFFDSEASIVNTMISHKKSLQKDINSKSDFIYDIVVKKVPSGKSALALYRNGELFMATYASVGLNDRKTQTGQYKVLGKDPYKRSRKYGNAPMPEALNFCGGFYIHQGNVSGYPLSHGCVRLPGIYADVVYSSVKNARSVDVFVSKNLYK